MRTLAALGALLLVTGGSLAAETVITWDPGAKPATGSDGGGTWNGTNTNFTNGTADVAFANSDTVEFGVGGTAGTVTVAGNTKNINGLKFFAVTGTAGANGFIPGYTFTGNTILSPTTLTLSTTAVGSVQVLTTINDPLIVNYLNFTTAAALSLGGGSTQLGKDNANNPSPNISANSVNAAAACTLQLNAILASTETYTIGTSIAIGAPVANGNIAAGTGGVQVYAGATLTPTTVAANGLTDLGVGGYAANNTQGNTNGSGLLTINAGGTAKTTTSSSTVYINNNTGTPVNGTTPASGPGTSNLAGRLIVNGANGTVASGTGANSISPLSGVLSASNNIVIGNALAPDASHTQSAELDVNGPTGAGVNGGVVYLASSGGTIYLNDGGATSTNNLTALLNIAGGVTTLGPSGSLNFNFNSSGGTSTLAVSAGSLFLGSGGLFDGAPRTSSATAAINLSGGTLGAVAAWSTTGSQSPVIPLTLVSGTTTFQTSNLGASNPNAASPTTTFYTAANASAYNITLTSALSGAGGLNATGGGISGGTLSLTAASVYSGPTSVDGGATLLITGSLGSPTIANGSVTVNGNGTLVLNGTIGTTATPGGAVAVNNAGLLLVNGGASINASTVTVNGGGTLGGTGLLSATSAAAAGTVAPGAASGASTGTLTLSAGSGVTLTGTLLIGAASGGTSSFLSTASQLTLNGAILTVSGTLDGVSTYEVATYGTLTGTFANAAPAGYVVNYAGSTFAGSVAAPADIELDVAPIPEPGPLAATAAAAFGLLLARRRSRRLAPPAGR